MEHWALILSITSMGCMRWPITDEAETGEVVAGELHEDEAVDVMLNQRFRIIIPLVSKEICRAAHVLSNLSRKPFLHPARLQCFGRPVLASNLSRRPFLNPARLKCFGRSVLACYSTRKC